MATEYKGDEFMLPDEEKEAPVQQELDIDAGEDKSNVKAESEDPTDEELAQYDETVRNKLKKYTNNYHNERRARKAAQREREEAENFAKSVIHFSRDHPTYETMATYSDKQKDMFDANEEAIACFCGD
jgi:hypothetical protein